MFFGFRKFRFNIERNNYTNYQLIEFIYLYILYLCLCFCQGIVALLPLQIIKKGYIFYDKFNDRLKKEENNNIQNEKKVVNIHNNNDSNIQNILTDLKKKIGMLWQIF